MRRVTRLAVALAFAVSGVAFGEVTDGVPDNDELQRFERWGPLRARPRLGILEMGWDTNIFNAPTGQETGDFRFTAAPGLEGLVLFGDRAFLRFDSELRYTAYSAYSDLNYFDTQNEARLTFPVGRWSVYSGGRYDRVRKTPIDVDDVRPLYITGVAELGLSVRTSAKGSFELAHAYTDREHEDDDFGILPEDLALRLDRVERENRATYRHELGGRTTLFFELSRSDIVFDTPSPDGPVGTSRDSRATRLLPGIALDPHGQWAGQVEFGYAELASDEASLAEYSGTVGRAELRYRPARRATFTLTAEREVDFSASEGNNYHVLDRARLNYLQFFGPSFGLELEAGRGTLEFPATTRKDDLFQYWGGVRLRTLLDAYGRRIEYRVGIGRKERESTEPQRDRAKTALTIDAVFGY